MSIVIPKKRRQPIVGRPLTAAAERVHLLLLADAPNADGEPRAALLMPPAAAALSRRPMVKIFASLAAAIAAKAELEEAR